ncbi:MAG: hypothetical protein F6K54_13035 [Okeania sp. SIO3B5]|uniref:hypothetical protein n=1 Tax=Okeania sp. SIO3B5 TaxID=2607811 RepID=UPI0014011130|nr:hypothetical protein [Okeania sp. SIO3B5]NEO53920.1 hypothetical protein [Okeania sp. SIO3B5]
MTTDLYFYIVNYNKNIPIYIVKNTRKVDSDSIEGQEVIKSIDKLNVAGIAEVTENQINILSSNLDFYIEAMTNKLDATKRPAKIGIKGKLPASSLNYYFEDWIFEIRNKIQDFAEKIEQPIQENQLETIELNLRNIYYKNQDKRKFLRIGKLLIKIFTPVILALIIIKYFFSEIELILVGFLIAINNIIMWLIRDK